MTLFTGSQSVADKLIHITHGRVKLEDAGFDWKILGPDGASFTDKEVKMAGIICDQDAFALSGQKCSSQSILFAHDSWVKRGLVNVFVDYSKKRNFDDLTVGPVLSWNNAQISDHQNKILSFKNTKLISGGKPLERQAVPEV
mmetsp:Transcript_91069/g.197004  ORF Transcript_91069/g.197004 Transcript_91069/m.197004 type:complete len:142 (-) Transcript_91069:467-892(-)